MLTEATAVLIFKEMRRCIKFSNDFDIDCDDVYAFIEKVSNMIDGIRRAEEYQESLCNDWRPVD